MADKNKRAKKKMQNVEFKKLTGAYKSNQKALDKSTKAGLKARKKAYSKGVSALKAIKRTDKRAVRKLKNI